MFKLNDNVIVAKGPMKGNIAVVKNIHRPRIGIRIGTYLNPATTSGLYYVMEDELKLLATMDVNSLYPRLAVDVFCSKNIIDKTCIKIKKVIFNGPATIVFWNDNTKTIVKCRDNELHDPEKGLAMAFSKKLLGNNCNYYNVFLKYLKQYEKQHDEQYDINNIMETMLCD